MNNPWKQYSKLNPQREDGNRQIATDVFHSLMSVNLSGAEFRIVLTIIDKTWGFNKETDCISVSQFMELTGIAERTIKDCLKNLKEKRIIFYESSNIRGRCGSPLNEFLFNKHYDTWKPQGCGNLHACKKTSNKGAKKRILRVSKTAYTKEIITKERITKEKCEENSIEYMLAEKLFSLIKERRNTYKQPDLFQWADHIRKMISVDKRDADEISKIIILCQEDNFWQNNILSTAKLREKFDMLCLKLLKNRPMSQKEYFDSIQECI